MPEFAVLIEDDGLVSSDNCAVYRSFDEAIAETVESAIRMIAERFAIEPGRRLLTCLVRNSLTGEQRAYQVVIGLSTIAPPLPREAN